MNYTPLNIISSYSPLKSSLKINEIIEFSKKNNLSSASITELNNFSSVFKFYTEAKKENIKPLIGININIFNVDFIVYPKNFLSLENLFWVSTLINSYQSFPNESFKNIEEFIKEIIDKISDDILIINENDFYLFKNYLNKNINRNDVYFKEVLELDKINSLLNDEKFVIDFLHELDNKSTIKFDHFSLEKFSEKNVSNSAIELNNEIIKKINIEIPLKKSVIPSFQNFSIEKSFSYLVSLTKKGLQKRISENSNVDIKKYYGRLEYELRIIRDLNFSNYFLIVWDVVNFLKKEGTNIGSGRGSSVGSLIAYSLGITNIDPIKYNLIFERFINPQRSDLPDIDIDVPDIKRENVISYIKKKYGAKKVSQIVSFSNFSKKQLTNDINSLNRNNNKLTDQSKINFLIKRLEGNPRQTSKHAAGIIISDEKLSDKIPLIYNNKTLISQFESKDMESFGFIKFDILGLKNLSFYNDILNQINLIDPDFNINKININDEKTISLFQNGDTNGIFQFESRGMKQTLKKINPSNFNDLVSANALFRPGPMKHIDQFIKNKNNIKNISFDDKDLETILKDTYGIIVFQEQIMQIAIYFAGMTPSESDFFRRAISKKDNLNLVKLKDRFINSSVNNGKNFSLAKKVFDLVKEFGNYGFNKSHAVAYSDLAFKLAYLKVNFPANFFSVYFDKYNSEERVNENLNYLKHHNVSFSGPSINKSIINTFAEGNSIVFGFDKIRGLDSSLIEDILNKRKNGSYTSIKNLFSRLDKKNISKEKITPLIFSGALDGLDLNRKEIFKNLDDLVFSSNYGRNVIDQFELEKTKEYPEAELIQQENNFLPFSITGLNNFWDTPEGFEQLYNFDFSNKNHDIKVFVTKFKKIRAKNGKEMAFATITDVSGEKSLVIFPNKFNNQLEKKIKSNKTLKLNVSEDKEKKDTVIFNNVF